MLHLKLCHLLTGSQLPAVIPASDQIRKISVTAHSSEYPIDQPTARVPHNYRLKALTARVQDLEFLSVHF